MIVRPNVHLFRGLISNYYILVGPSSMYMIDCGLASDYRKILKSLNSLGYPTNPLEYILITHADGDHYGAAAHVKKYTDAFVAAREAEKQAMESGTSSRPLKGTRIQSFMAGIIKPLFASPPVKVDQVIIEEVTFPIFSGLQAVFTPGHTPDHCSFWLPESRILFAGDSIWNVSGKPAPTHGANCWDARLAQQSFEIQMNLKPAVICAGHTCLFI